MRKFKKFLALALGASMVLSMTACSLTGGNKAQSIETDAGDKIKVSCDTSDGLSMNWNKDKEILTVKDGKDDALELVFVDEDKIEEYCEEASGEVEVKTTDEHDGVVYTLFASEDDDDEKHYIVGWIVGSDSGIIAEGTDSKKGTLNAFKALEFEIEDTDQDDDDFYVEDVEEIESKGEKEDEKPVDDEKKPDETKPDEGELEETEPDETEPKDEEKEEPKDEKEDKEDKDEPKLELTGDWKDFQFTLAGKSMTLPVSYADLKEATGLSIKSTEEKSWLEPNYYTACSLRDANGEVVAYVDILNNTDEDIEIKNGIIIQIYQDTWGAEKGVSLSICGLKIGDVTSKDELIAKFGQPTDVYEYRIDEDDDEEWVKYETDTYTWSLDEDWTTMDYIEIEFNIHTGVIEEISYDHSGEIE